MDNHDVLFKRAGRRIRTLREEAGLTQGELAKAIGVNRSTVTRYEDGEISSCKASTLASLATVLDVDLKTLLGHNLEGKPELVDFFAGHAWNEDEVEQLIDFGRFLIAKRR